MTFFEASALIMFKRLSSTSPTSGWRDPKGMKKKAHEKSGAKGLFACVRVRACACVCFYARTSSSISRLHTYQHQHGCRWIGWDMRGVDDGISGGTSGWFGLVQG